MRCDRKKVVSNEWKWSIAITTTPSLSQNLSLPQIGKKAGQHNMKRLHASFFSTPNDMIHPPVPVQTP